VIALATDDPEIKLRAAALAEPWAVLLTISACRHVCHAEIANSHSGHESQDQALELLGEPLRASQVPVRDVAVDVINSIVNAADHGTIVLAVLHALGEPVRSGNNV